MLMQCHCKFPCEGAELVGTLTVAPGTTGLLIVSGGNEIRAGSWNGQALLAARLAARGFPVLRFDRRGIGDSAGINGGFRSSAKDIEAALAAFREQAPHVRRIVAFGNCDAASALMLGGGFGCDALILSNPWTIEQAEDETTAPPPPAALRAHYLRRLTDPAALLRLLKGGVSITSVAKSLRDLMRKPEPTALATEIAAGLAGYAGPVTILLAERDRTAQAFLATWLHKADPRLRRCAEASHSYVEPSAQEWLENQLVAAISSVSD